MAVFLSPVGGVAAQFFTNTGAVLTGGKLYTYLAGTTTPAATYTSSGGGTFNPNPIVLDAAGRVPSSGEIWLTDGSQYKFVLKDSNDVLIATYDNITGINSNFTNFLANQEIQTATAGQTVFTLANAYVPGANTLSVFVDGVNQYGPGATYAYLETNSSTVTFVSGLHVGASVKFTTVQSLTSTQSTSAALVSYAPAGTGAVATTVQAKLRQYVSVQDFGADPNGVADSTTAIQNAITYCQTTLKDLYFGPGIFSISSTISLSGNPISFIGEGFAVNQQGSQLPSSTISWTGGASPMFNISSGGWRFTGFAARNMGSATCFIYSENTQYLYIDNCSFVLGNGTNKFTTAIFYSLGNNFGYSKFTNNIFQGQAPKFIYINGNGASNGVTAIEMYGGLFESNSSGDVSIVSLKDTVVTQLSMHNSTYNQQLNTLCLVDTTDTPQSITIASLYFYDNEVDTAGGPSTSVRFKLTNVLNAGIDNNYFQSGGSATTMANLVNTNVTSFAGNYCQALNGSFFTADATSRVTVGANNFVLGNTQGIVNDSSTGSGVIPVTWAATTYLNGNLVSATANGIYRINVTAGTSWTLSYHNPVSGYFVRGQVLTIQIRNTSGGTIASPTLPGTFKTAGALAMPATGYSRSYTMFWDGTNLVEISRTAADVPN